jgi:hypothetical protein
MKIFRHFHNSIKLLCIVFFSTLHLTIFGQIYTSLDPNDTTKYELISSLKDFKNFGYNYADKNVLLNVYFREISNTYLSSSPEVNVGTSREGFSTYYDSKKIKELVGFTVCQGELRRDILWCDEFLYNIYGYQKDILDQLKRFKKESQIVILGKVVKYPNGEEYGIRVKYAYTLEEFNDESQNEVSSQSNSDEVNGSTRKSSFNIPWFGILFWGSIIVIGLYYKNKGSE